MLLDPATGVLSGEHLWYDNPKDKWWHYLWERTPDGKVTRHPAREGFRSDYSFVRDGNGRMYRLDGAKVMTREREQATRMLTDVGRPANGILTVTV